MIRVDKKDTPLSPSAFFDSDDLNDHTDDPDKSGKRKSGDDHDPRKKRTLFGAAIDHLQVMMHNYRNLCQEAEKHKERLTQEARRIMRGTLEKEADPRLMLAHVTRIQHLLRPAADFKGWHELVTDLVHEDLLEQRGLLCCVSKRVPLIPILLRNEVIDRECLSKTHWTDPITRQQLDEMPRADHIHMFCYKVATEGLLRKDFSECMSTIDRYTKDLRHSCTRMKETV